MNTPNHILVIRLSALGDVAMAVPVLRVFRKTYPDIDLTVISRPQFKALFKDIPRLHFLEADVYGKHKGFGLLRLAREAKETGIDAIADLHNVLRSKGISLYLGLQGLTVQQIDKGRTEKKQLIQQKKPLEQLKSTHQRYADVFAKLGCPLNLETYDFPPKASLGEVTQQLIGRHTKKMIGIAPFAAYPSKMYPLDRMKQLIQRLNGEHRYHVYLFGGGPKEVEILSEWGESFENVTNLAGRLNLEQELQVMSHLDLMLAMDSSNGHLAAIYGIPVVTLWGVTHPHAGFTPFEQPDAHQLMADRKLYPLIPTSIYGNKYPDGYENAMQTISVEAVFQKISEII